jgi:hypothetical protein
MPDEETSRLSPGYRLDLVGDPCIIILRGPDGRVVARFSRDVDPEEIRRAVQAAQPGTRGWPNTPPGRRGWPSTTYFVDSLRWDFYRFGAFMTTSARMRPESRSET